MGNDMQIPQSFQDSVTAIADEIAAGPGWVLISTCRMTKQEHDNWCWASVCQAVDRSHGREFTQCDIAHSVLPTACSGQCDDDDCDQPVVLSDALLRRARLRQRIDGQITFEAVKAEIRPPASKVICCPIDRDAGAHALIICGFHEATKRIAIFDPLLDSGPHSHDFAAFTQEYSEGGKWTLTCLTR
jgi:hypothetical protein